MRFIEEILELEKVGWINPPDGMLQYLRGSKEFQNIRKFKASGNTKGAKKYSTYDLFGCHIKYYIYKIDMKEKFQSFITKEFLKNNPKPNKGLLLAFMVILHDNYLEKS